jgi:hypothetical protein
MGASAGKAKGALDILDYQLKKLDNSWQLYTLTTQEAEGSTAYLAQQKAILAEKLALVGTNLASLSTQYAATVADEGAMSKSAMELGTKIDDLRIKQAEWTKELEGTTKAVEDLFTQISKQTSKAGKTYSDYLAAAAGFGASFEMKAVKDKHGRDTGQRELVISHPMTEAYKKGEMGIPVFDGGGVFRAPAGQTHGPAILQDKETVLPPGVAVGGASAITIPIYLDGREIARYTVKHIPGALHAQGAAS